MHQMSTSKLKEVFEHCAERAEIWSYAALCWSAWETVCVFTFLSVKPLNVQQFIKTFRINICIKYVHLLIKQYILQLERIMQLLLIYFNVISSIFLLLLFNRVTNLSVNASDTSTTSRISVAVTRIILVKVKVIYIYIAHLQHSKSSWSKCCTV